MDDPLPPDPGPDEVPQSRLERLASAVQEFVAEGCDYPVIVTDAVLFWEQTRYEEDGSVAPPDRLRLDDAWCFGGS